MKRLAHLVAALATVSIVFALAAVSASATHVQCGDTITQNTTLDSDLLDCPGDGVIIGAPGITLDLGGHTIDGTGVGDGHYGVDDQGFDGITVTGGRIQEFFSAVYLDDANANVVRNLTVTSTGQAIYLEHADGNLIERNVVTSSGNGVYVLNAGKDNVIAANSFTGGGGGVTLVGSMSEGFEIDRTRIERNRLSGNFTGYVAILEANTLLRANRVVDNTDLGIAEAGNGSLIEGNTVTGNGIGISISGLSNRASRNRVTGNGGDGITIGGGTAALNTVLERNVASGNGDDGIDANGISPATITRNTANENADLGIEAEPGVTDGGGNKARRNGNPAQCTGVSCK